MSRIEINAGGRHIIVDHDGELAYLAETAERLWTRTDTARPLGFRVTERAPSTRGELRDASYLARAGDPPTSGE